MTDMPACLWGAALELETHFSLLKINTSHSPPSRFWRGKKHPKIINTAERNNAHSMKNCWRGLSLFSATIMTKLHFCEFWAAPFPTFPSPSGNIWIIHERGWIAHKWFPFPHKEKCLFRNDLLVLLLRDSSSNYRGIVGFRTELPMMMWITSKVSQSQWLLPIWFLCPGNSFCASEKKNECSLLLSPTVFNHSTSCGKANLGT